MIPSAFLARCAPIAIAIAASPATPAFAQDAAVQPAPVIVLDTAPAPASQPTITLPTTTAPAVEAAPTVAEPAPATTTTTSTAVKPAAAKPATTSVGASSNMTPAARSITATPSVGNATTAERVAAGPADTAPAAPVLTDEQPVVAPQPAPAPINDGSTAALWFGLAAALGMGAAAYAFTRSRRRRNAIVSAPPIERPLDRVEPVPVRAEKPVTASAPVAAYSEPAYRAAPVTARTTGDTGSMVLPDEVPESYEERDALLRDMIEAEPDRANPFRSPKARARRARLIMQSLGRTFESRKPRFDLSQYSGTWPALRGWQPATA